MHNTAQNIVQNTAENVLNYRFPALVTIDTIQEIAAALRSLILKSGVTFIVDTTDVQVITTPGVQLLMSLAQYTHKSDGIFRLTSISAPVRQAFEGLGLLPYLQEWEMSND